MGEVTNATHFISNLSATGLMALIIVVLAIVVKNFYEKSEKERKVLLDKIFNALRGIEIRLDESNKNQKENTLVNQAQRELLEKNYQLQNNVVNKSMENVHDSIVAVGKDVNRVDGKVEEVKKEVDTTKKIAGATYKKTDTLVNLWNNKDKITKKDIYDVGL